MKALMLFAGSGPLLILTSHPSATDPGLLEKLRAKGIDKFIAHELPVDAVRERYGGHFQVVTSDLRESDDCRVPGLQRRASLPDVPPRRDRSGHRLRPVFLTPVQPAAWSTAVRAERDLDRGRQIPPGCGLGPREPRDVARWPLALEPRPPDDILVKARAPELDPRSARPRRRPAPSPFGKGVTGSGKGVRP
jgi:hypothetical protein